MTRRDYRSHNVETCHYCRSRYDTRPPTPPHYALCSGTAMRAPSTISYDLWNTPRDGAGNYLDSRTRNTMPSRFEYAPRNNYSSAPRTPVAITVYADASLDGFGFWSPQLNQGFYGDLPRMPLLDDINFMEYYAVANAISWASKRLEPGGRLRVYTDSLNTVDKFNGGPAEEEYDELIETVDDIVEEADIDLSVWHIPGVKNDIADCLSRPNSDFDYIYDVKPDLKVSYYNVSKRIERCAGY